MKPGVEFAPKYDFNIQDKENKELRKVYEPLQKELKKEKITKREKKTYNYT